MQEFIYSLIGLLIPFALSWLFAKLKPETAQKVLSDVLSKVLKNEKQLNKTENVVGDKLIELGSQIKGYHPDEEEKAEIVE